MAITIIRIPDPNKIYSLSYPFNNILQSELPGQPNVTVHRFVLDITVDGEYIGHKIFSSIEPPDVTYDVNRVLKNYVELSENVEQLGVLPNIFIPDMVWNGSWGYNHQVIDISIDVWESYVEDGEQKSRAGFTYTYKGVRGKSDISTEYIWANRFDEIGSPIYAGVGYFKNFAFALNLMKYAPLVSNRLIVTTQAQYSDGTEGVEASKIDILAPLPDIQIVYLPIREWVKPFKSIIVRVKDFTDLIDEILIIAPQVDCEQDGIELMFQDRYNQWSFLSFPKKNYMTINKEVNEVELAERGRVQYSPEGVEQIRISSDNVNEGANWLFQDLFMSTDIYLSSEGHVKVNVTDRVWNEFKSENEKVFNYVFTIEKAIDIFVP